MAAGQREPTNTRDAQWSAFIHEKIELLDRHLRQRTDPRSQRYLVKDRHGDVCRPLSCRSKPPRERSTAFATAEWRSGRGRIQRRGIRGVITLTCARRLGPRWRGRRFQAGNRGSALRSRNGTRNFSGLIQSATRADGQQHLAWAHASQFFPTAQEGVYAGELGGAEVAGG